MLQSIAPEYGGILDLLDGYGRATVTIRSPAGKEDVFILDVRVDNFRVSVSEASPRRLPSACPDRHINLDGTFCLGWGQDDLKIVSDSVSAQKWWATIVRFLGYQINANRRGIWPGSENDRAHGDAAEPQEIAERMASSFGPRFTKDLLHGRIRVLFDDREPNPKLELLRHGKRIARVFWRTKSLVTDRVRCPCDSSAVVAMPIAECQDHARKLEIFTVALYEWRERENLFFQERIKKGHMCCGTLQSCRLRDATIAAQIS